MTKATKITFLQDSKIIFVNEGIIKCSNKDCQRVIKEGNPAYMCAIDKSIYCIGCKDAYCVNTPINFEHIDYYGILKIEVNENGNSN